MMQPLMRQCASLFRSSAPLRTTACLRSLSGVAHLQPDQHPWLKKVAGPSTLTAEERVLTFLAANVGAGNLAGVVVDWDHLPDHLHGKGLEVVLQAHALSGFPRTINALMAIHKQGIHAPDSKHYDEKLDLKSWRDEGTKTLEAVYGGVASKMRANFKGMHPLLESVMVEHIYGRILSRPLVGLRMRELCTLSILVGQDVPLQLVSHIRGSLRCGATRDEVNTIVEQTGLAWGEKALTQARTVKDDMFKKDDEKEKKK